MTTQMTIPAPSAKRQNGARVRRAAMMLLVMLLSTTTTMWAQDAISGHVISADNTYVGLFCKVDAGIVKNLCLISPNITNTYVRNRPAKHLLVSAALRTASRSPLLPAACLPQDGSAFTPPTGKPSVTTSSPSKTTLPSPAIVAPTISHSRATLSASTPPTEKFSPPRIVPPSQVDGTQPSKPPTATTRRPSASPHSTPQRTKQ